METRTTIVGDLPMRWKEQGEGIPLVFIHGIPTGPMLWREVIPRVTGARCLAWEMVGYGASIPEGAGRDISVARQAEYLLAWLNHLELRSVVLAGHDLGGGVAQIAAVRHPERCAGLLLANAIGYDSWPIPSVAAMQKLHQLVAALPDGAIRATLRVFLRRGHDRADRAEAAFRVHWPHYERAGAAEAFARQIRALDARDTLDVADRLPAVGVPARVIWGVADRFQKIRYGNRFARDLRAPLRRLETARHFIPEDRPGEVAEEVNLLLAEVRARTSRV